MTKSGLTGCAHPLGPWPPTGQTLQPPDPHTSLPLSCMHDKDLRHKLATPHVLLHILWPVQQHLLLICSCAGQSEAVFCLEHGVLRLESVAALLNLMTNLHIRPARLIAVCLQACKLFWQH